MQSMASHPRVVVVVVVSSQDSEGEGRRRRRLFDFSRVCNMDTQPRHPTAALLPPLPNSILPDSFTATNVPAEMPPFRQPTFEPAFQFRTTHASFPPRVLKFNSGLLDEPPQMLEYLEQCTCTGERKKVCMFC